jgi:hypothetical protein
MKIEWGGEGVPRCTVTCDLTFNFFIRCEEKQGEKFCRRKSFPSSISLWKILSCPSHKQPIDRFASGLMERKSANGSLERESGLKTASNFQFVPNRYVPECSVPWTMPSWMMRPHMIHPLPRMTRFYDGIGLG